MLKMDGSMYGWMAWRRAAADQEALPHEAARRPTEQQGSILFACCLPCIASFFGSPWPGLVLLLLYWSGWLAPKHLRCDFNVTSRSSPLYASSIQPAWQNPYPQVRASPIDGASRANRLHSTSERTLQRGQNDRLKPRGQWILPHTCSGPQVHRAVIQRLQRDKANLGCARLSMNSPTVLRSATTVRVCAGDGISNNLNALCYL